jgi:SAM-dependent methyltransferase
LLIHRRKPADPSAPTAPGRGEFDDVADHYDYLMRSIPYSDWIDYVEALMRHHDIPARVVFDLCCGTGRVGSEMLRRGYECVGADLSEKMVRHCHTQVPPLPAAVMDARRLGLRAAAFDLVVCLYDSLNYILEPEGLESCFGGVAHGLRPGAWLIFDMNTTFALAAGFFASTNVGSAELLEYTWKPSWNPSTKICRIEMNFRWLGDGGPFDFREVHYQRAYEIPELTEMLGRAGFTQIEFYHGYSLNRPTRYSDRIFVAARKAGK